MPNVRAISRRGLEGGNGSTATECVRKQTVGSACNMSRVACPVIDHLVHVTIKRADLGGVKGVSE